MDYCEGKELGKI